MSGRPEGSALRSIAFNIWMYGWLALMGFAFLPLLLKGRPGALKAIRIWARTVLWGLEAICGARIEVRGLEHRPAGRALIGAKHQGMLDTVVPFVLLNDPCFVLKSELMKLPIYGWYALVAEMIPVERAGHSTALRALVREAKVRLDAARQIVIYPEGTRKPVGAATDYKPGVAALYRELELPCWPLATNSGLVWPPKGDRFRPGVAVFEFLPPIPAGLKRAEFMSELETRLETASDRLAAEGEGLTP
jgi:1-acyl-sn-glycerol-3-phosphate acyltransferase